MTSVERTKVGSYNAGVLGEIVVCFLLLCAGCSVVCRRFLSKFGEVDIIALSGSRLSFVEVKCTASEFLDFPLSMRQCRSIVHAANVFLGANHPIYSDYLIAFDLFLLSTSRLVYIPDAWDACVLEL